MDSHSGRGGVAVRVLCRRGIVVAALLLFFFLALQAAVSKSPTADEGMHALRGAILWQTGDLSLQGQHTPLSHWLIGALLPLEPTLPVVDELPSWSIRSADQLVQEFVLTSGTDVSRLLLLSRLPIIFAGLLLGALLARWGWGSYGLLGMAIAVIFFAFSPNLLASAALATTDLLAAATYTAAIYSMWYYWQKPSRVRWLLVGLTLGLGLSAKLTGILLLPILLVLSYTRKRDGPWWQPGLVWLSWLPAAVLILWAVYRFEFGSTPGIPLAIPAPTYLGNFIEVQEHIDRGHYAYLLGQRSNEGWWLYFVAAFFLKSPLVTIALLLFSVVYITRIRGWMSRIFIWLPLTALFAAASYSRLNIGYRHILPVLPLIWLLIASTAAFWEAKPGRRRLLYAALALYAALTFRQSPHFLAYFNELVGGSAQGYRYLGDSNIDWGQDLTLLADYVLENDKDPLFISYFGPSSPEYYGLDPQPMFDSEGTPLDFAPANPHPGRYVISANHWQGTTEVEPDLFDWFRQRPPDDHIGFSLLIFDVDESSGGSWIAHCTDPAPLVDEQLAEKLVSLDSPRHLYFDCRSSWVIPGGGQESGWFILPADLEPTSAELYFPNLLSNRYNNLNSPTHLPYAIYYWPGVSGLETKIAEASISLFEGDAAVNAPIIVDGLARLLGVGLDGSMWTSFWGAVESSDEPLSIKMHLYDSEPTPLVMDGLGFTADQWQAGDIFIQFARGEDENYETLETAIYNYITGEAIPFSINGTKVDSIRARP